MPIRIYEPIWIAISRQWRDRITGQFMSPERAVPFLRAWPSLKGRPDVVIRDVLGHYVPRTFYGGNVLAHFPTGKGHIAAVTRAMPGPPEDFLYRARDCMDALVHYRIEGGPLQEIQVRMPKGIAYDEDIFEDRFVSRIIERDPDTYEMIGPPPEYEIIGVDWAVTTYYGEGTMLGEDISRFGGLQ